MAKVAVLFKIYADEGQEAAVSKRIGEQLKPTGMQMEEIAFGIKIIKAMFIYDDSEGGSSRIEDDLKKIQGVREVEVIEESLV